MKKKTVFTNFVESVVLVYLFCYNYGPRLSLCVRVSR